MCFNSYMKKKIRLGIIFGGKSGEHEVSLQSAKNIMEALDKNKYEVIPIGIDKKGSWRIGDSSRLLLNAENPKLIKLNKEGQRDVALIPGENRDRFMELKNNRSLGEIDVVFPVLHGPLGEDGTVQGFLKLAGVPFVGSSVLGSAVGMDKDVMKRLLRDAGLPIADFVVLRSPDEVDFKKITKKLGLPVFIKPANLGSSVGISKAKNRAEFERAVENAFQYDRKVLVEEFVPGRELECAVLGNENPKASIPGEVIPNREFYSYEAKYIDENGAALEVPAKVSATMVKKIQELAIRAFKVLEAEGMARVDMFLRENGKLVINEINTIPGFTKISMYPKLWELSGVSYPELIDMLVLLAIDRFNKEKKIKTDNSS